MNNRQAQPQPGLHQEAGWIIAGIAVVMLFFSWPYWRVPLFSAWKALALPLAKVLAWLSTTLLGEWLTRFTTLHIAASRTLPSFLDAYQLPTDNALWYQMSAYLGHLLVIGLLPLLMALVCYYGYHTQGISHNRIRCRHGIDYLALANPHLTKVAGDSAATLSPFTFSTQAGLLCTDAAATPPILDQEKAAAVFTQQLGRPYTTWKDLLNTPYGYLVMPLVMSLPMAQRQAVLMSAQRLRYADTTVLLALAYASRRFGRLNWQHWLPLKTLYPALWYAIVSIGKKTVYAQGAAIIAQYEYEMALRQQADTALSRLPSTDTSAAIHGLTEALIEQPMESPPLELADSWALFDPSR